MIDVDLLAASAHSALKMDAQAVAGGVADFDTLDRIYRHVTGQPLRDRDAAIRLRTFLDLVVTEAQRGVEYEHLP